MRDVLSLILISRWKEELSSKKKRKGNAAYQNIAICSLGIISNALMGSCGISEPSDTLVWIVNGSPKTRTDMTLLRDDP
jgi:hypothetical protein